MLLVTGNTMSQAVRERTSEFAVFKTVGYSDKVILALVLSESVVICFISMIIGIILSFFVFLAFATDLSEFAGNVVFEYSVIAWAFIAALVMAMISGLPPAVGAMRLKVVDALRKD
jgi:putative ABC transport system permease protein